MKSLGGPFQIRNRLSPETKQEMLPYLVTTIEQAFS